ncbi:hypothetical protein GCM10022409_11680 [Hymenobacter glaciei]|uniref:Dipeptidylpeptidase IV N-terminal domain-containing protein n=2 Tax=Hymenobacter glaciei TaxID=877209 RepID=A0ABP7TPP0_9BACT
MLRHVVFDSLLHQKRQASLILAGYDLHLTDHALNNKAAFYRFRRKLNDTAFTAVIDTTGKILSFRREAYKQKLITHPPLPMASDSLFVLYSQANNEKSFTLECLDVQQRVRWKTPFASSDRPIYLVDFQSDAESIWIISADHEQEQTIWCLESRTGRVLSQARASDVDNKRFVESTLLLPDHSLVYAGRSLPAEARQRAISVKTGDLFLTRRLPNGRQLWSNTNANQSAPSAIVSPQDVEIRWEHLGIDPSGNYFLLGETFASTSAANNTAQIIAMHALVGYGYNTSSLTPVGFVQVKFDAKGTVLHTSVVPLPRTATFTELSYIPAQQLAYLAENRGFFRFRATSSDGNAVIMRNKKEFSVLHLDTQQMTPLYSGPYTETMDVWSGQGSGAVLYRAQPAKTAPPAPKWVSLP